MTSKGGLEEMVEKIFIYSDIHYPEHNVRALSCANKMIKDYKPSKIVLIGDALNMTPVSHWLLDKKRPMEGQRLVRDYEGFNKELATMLKQGGAQVKEVVYILGNHEEWINLYLDKHPEMEGLLEVEKNIKLPTKSKAKLKFVPYNEFYKAGKLLLTHGLYTNKYHAAKTVDSVNASVLYGHCHNFQTYTKVGLAKSTDKHMAMSIGCLSSMSPSYMKKRPNNWVHGVATVEVLGGGNFNARFIPIINGLAVMDKKVYKG